MNYARRTIPADPLSFYITALSRIKYSHLYSLHRSRFVVDDSSAELTRSFGPLRSFDKRPVCSVFIYACVYMARCTYAGSLIRQTDPTLQAVLFNWSRARWGNSVFSHWKIHILMSRSVITCMPTAWFKSLDGRYLNISSGT